MGDLIVSPDDLQIEKKFDVKLSFILIEPPETETCRSVHS